MHYFRQASKFLGCQFPWVGIELYVVLHIFVFNRIKESNKHSISFFRLTKTNYKGTKDFSNIALMKAFQFFFVEFIVSTATIKHT